MDNAAGGNVSGNGLQAGGHGAGKSKAEKSISGKAGEDSTVSSPKIGKLGKDDIAKLIATLNCDDPQKISDISKTLVNIGKPAIPFLIKELGNPNQFVQGAAITSLIEIGQESVKPVLLAIAIANVNQTILGAGKAVIRGIGQEAIPQLQIISDPKHPGHSSHCIDLLIELDAQAASTLTRYLKDGLGSSDQFKAGSAINTFVNIGKGAVPNLVGFLEDSDHQIQQNAISAIVTIGDASSKHLIDALGSESQLAQQNAYAAILVLIKFRGHGRPPCLNL
jgi:HEAT repeat protein